MINRDAVRVWALLAYPNNSEKRSSVMRQLTDGRIPKIKKDRIVNELVLSIGGRA